MSDSKRYFLHCDAPAYLNCWANEMGTVDESASRLRRRLKSKGWTHTRHELTEEEKRYKTKTIGRIKADYCPAHAHLAKEA